MPLSLLHRPTSTICPTSLSTLGAFHFAKINFFYEKVAKFIFPGEKVYFLCQGWASWGVELLCPGRHELIKNKMQSTKVLTTYVCYARVSFSSTSLRSLKLLTSHYSALVIYL